MGLYGNFQVFPPYFTWFVCLETKQQTTFWGSLDLYLRVENQKKGEKDSVEKLKFNWK